ncbi:MAG: formate--tetrahydrofolate ligase [Cryomorphaceae bacterium]|nr:formate--tetrahydrofolate ligase [Cryomorphaceae bacterium]
MNDIDIARSVTPQNIQQIAAKLNISTDKIIPYGHDKAKLPLDLIDHKRINKSHLILVTAISPTPAGEGKTTMSIGLAQGLSKIDKKTVAVLREPSLGPVFGMKGGAAGGGYSQVIPMEDINLHFTGDFSAIEKANNLLSALIDNNIQSKKNNLGIDPRTVVWKRVMDMNDRALRQIIVGMGGTANGMMRQTGFDITAASEVMAILCLSNDLSDLKRRLGNIFIGYTYDKKPVYARQLNAEGAMATLLKDAIKPNLVQTLEGTPAILHGGPFANIAQGTNSVLATKMGLSLADYVVTEAGFGADLGAEKFLDIKCVEAGLTPSAVVLLATVRALKYHGGMALSDLNTPHLDHLEKGFANLDKHIENIQQFGYNPVVAINAFTHDSAEEHHAIIEHCRRLGVTAIIANVWGEGGHGAKDLAKAVVDACDNAPASFSPMYQRDAAITEKIETIAKKIYGAKAVTYGNDALKALRQIDALNLNHLPVCIAKTQYSFSDDPKQLGRATDFTLNIRDIEIAAGAGFVVPITGEILRMPGLPATPAANNIDIDESGTVKGLF